MSWRLCCTLALLASVPFAPAHGQGPTGREPRPIVYLLEGIGGIDLIDVSAEIGFGWARLPHEIRRFYWSHGFGRWLRDLQDIRHTLARSEELAQEIRALKEKEPQRRVYLVAHSGGTGLAIRTAELLPADTLERVVLLSSAMSPYHDLRPALRTCKGGIISYHSRQDYLILNLGTTQFGTIDRHYQPSAGYAGFVVPSTASSEDRLLYGRLVQIPWSPRMMRQGNFGQHTGTVLPTFLGTEVAGWLR